MQNFKYRHQSHQWFLGAGESKGHKTTNGQKELFGVKKIFYVLIIVIDT